MDMSIRPPIYIHTRTHTNVHMLVFAHALQALQIQRLSQSCVEKRRR